MQDDQVERLDFSKPPPGYEVGYTNGEAYWMREPQGGEGHRGGVADDCGEATRYAWAHYKERHDPPGLTLRQGPHGLGFIALGKDSPVIGVHDWREQARAAAWAWYERRLALARCLDTEVVIVVDPDSDAIRVPTPRGRVAEVILPMLFVVDESDDAQIAEAREQAEVLLAKGRLTFEGDPPLLLDKVEVWPHLLAWSDADCDAVDRWLAAGGEVPEVLCG